MVPRWFSITRKRTNNLKLITMSKIKFVHNKVYNYVKGKSIVEIAMDGVCVALFGLVITGWSAFVFNFITKGL